MFTFLDGSLPAPNNRLYGFYIGKGARTEALFTFSSGSNSSQIIEIDRFDCQARNVCPQSDQ